MDGDGGPAGRRHLFLPRPRGRRRGLWPPESRRVGYGRGYVSTSVRWLATARSVAVTLLLKSVKITVFKSVVYISAPDRVKHSQRRFVPAAEATGVAAEAAGAGGGGCEVLAGIGVGGGRGGAQGRGEAEARGGCGGLIRPLSNIGLLAGESDSDSRSTDSVSSAGSATGSSSSSYGSFISSVRQKRQISGLSKDMVSEAGGVARGGG